MIYYNANMHTSLSSRERILRAIQHRSDIDRVPIIFRASPAMVRRLRERLNLQTDLQVLRHFGSDAIAISPAFKPGARQEAGPDGLGTDILGNRYKVLRDVEEESSAVVAPILAKARSATDVMAMRWPTAEILDIARCKREAATARATGRAVYGGIWASLFTMARNCMGEEHFLVSTIENPQLVDAVLQRLTQFYLELNHAYLEACAPDLDVYYFGSDLGTQRSLFMSEEMCRKFIFPGLRRLAEQAHGFGLKAMYHTCGAVSGIIDDLIHCGVDVLDPVQVSAEGMAPQCLKRFKGRIAFHGAISTQTTLPFGSPEEVEQAVRSTLETLGPEGVIAGPDQDVIGQAPLENLEAMCRAIRCFGT